MKALRFLLRVLKRGSLALLAFVLVYALLAIVLPRIAVNSDAAPPNHGTFVFVASNGVHTDFIVPVRTSVIDWAHDLPCEWFDQVDRSYDYVEFGWGDKGFYLETPTWSDLKFTTAFKAVFFLDASVMHVTYLRYPPRTDDLCRRLVLSEDQYRKLVEFLQDSFERDGSGTLRRIDHAGYTPQDRFFDARGTYSFIRTCNAWTGSGLKAIGVKTGLWTPFASDVFRYLNE